MGSLLLAALLGASAGPEPGLVVRASEAAVPCVAVAGQVYERATNRRVSIETGAATASGAADVIVAFDVEMTRAVEAGFAADGTEKDVARVPWVLSVPSGNPAGIRDLDDLGRDGLEVWVLSGPAAYEARREAVGRAGSRLRESADAAVLRAALVALVPLSLAGPGDRIAVDVRPLVAEAAVGTRSTQPDAARAFVAFLASEPGQKAFATCGR